VPNPPQVESDGHDPINVLRDGSLLAPVTVTDQGVDVRTLPAPVLVTPLAGSGEALSPDRQTLATRGDVGDVELWDVASPADPVLRSSLPGEAFAIGDVAFSSDGKSLAVGTATGLTQLWDLSDITRPVLGERLPGVPAGVDDVEFGFGSSRLVVVSDDRLAPLDEEYGLPSRSVVRIWSVRGATRATSTSEIDSGRQAVPAWSSDGRYIIAGFPAHLWDLQDPRFPRRGPALPTLAVGGGAVFVYQPGTDVLVSGVPAVLWDVSDPAAPRRLSTRTVREPADLALFSPDGDLLAMGPSGRPVSLWSVVGGSASRLVALAGTRAEPHGAAFLQGGSLLVATDRRRGATVFDVSDAERARRLGRIRSGSEGVTALATDGRSTTLVTGGERGRLSVWDLSDPAAPQLSGARDAHTGPMTGVAISPDGRLLASAGEDAVRLWARDPATGDLVPTATLESGGLYDGAALGFSSDGSLLAASTNQGIRIWDVDVDRLLASLCAESEPITREQWDEYLPDGMAYDPPCLTGREGPT
jgi:WD40 repeat protein